MTTRKSGAEHKGMRGKASILTVRNHHVDTSPNFDQIIEAGDYVSYFESELGDQWIFVRKRGADHATVYGGDIAWEGVTVREHSAEQMRETLDAEASEENRAKTRRLLAEMMKMADPLVPGLILNDSERTWLYNAWWTSASACDAMEEHEIALDVIAHRIAERYALSGLTRHPNTKEYRGAMAVIAVAVGREAGRRGMHEDDAGRLLEKTLQALPT